MLQSRSAYTAFMEAACCPSILLSVVQVQQQQPCLKHMHMIWLLHQVLQDNHCAVASEWMQNPPRHCTQGSGFQGEANP